MAPQERKNRENENLLKEDMAWRNERKKNIKRKNLQAGAAPFAPACHTTLAGGLAGAARYAVQNDITHQHRDGHLRAAVASRHACRAAFCGSPRL